MAVKYLSNRVKDLRVGINNYSEDRSSLTVIGNVGIGTQVPTDLVGSGNTAVLAAGIVTAYRIYSTLYGEFQGGSVTADRVVGSALSISGISTLGTVKISSGIVTATSGVVTYYGDGSNLSGTSTPGIVTTGTSTFENIIVNGNAGIGSLNVTGVSTFRNDVTFTGDSADLKWNKTLNRLDFPNATSVVFGNSAELKIYTSGTTPIIEVGDNKDLNLNANTVAISTNFTVGGASTFTGNITANGNIVGDNATNISGINSVTATTFYGSGVNLTGVTTSGGSTSAWIADAEGNLVAGTLAGVAIDADTFFNVIIGSCAGQALNEGDANVLIGKNAGLANTSGGYNIFLGAEAGKAVSTGGANIAIGCDAGAIMGSTSAVMCNISLGVQAGRCYCAGNDNILIGRESGKDAIDGEYNIFMGLQAGCAVTEADNNIFLGYRAGNTVTTGCCNIAIGRGAAVPSATGNCQLALGIDSNNWLTGNANWNVGIGTTNPDISVGAGNTAVLAVGILTAYQLYGDGSKLTGITTAGGSSTAWKPDAQENLYAGTTAGEDSDADTCCNIGIGYSALHSNCAGDKNIAIGACAGSKVLSGGCNIFLGAEAGECAVGTGSLIDNIAIGKHAGRSLNDTYFNVFIGTQAGQHVSTGHRNILIGHFTGCKGPMTGCNNTFLGEYAGRCNTSGDNNIGLGELAMGTGVVTGNNNISIGKNAGCSVTGGCYNIFLGMLAGNTNTSGCNNIAIGCDVELPSATGNTQLAIGAGATTWISGDSSFNVTLAGIVTAYASGIVSATSFYGDGSNLTGTGGETLISGITVKEQSSTVGTAGSITILDFQGSTITATASGSDTAVITVDAAGGLWESNATGINTSTNIGIGTTNASPATLTVDVGTAVTAVSIAGTTGQLLTVNNKLIEGSIFSVNDISGVPSIDVDADGTIQLAPIGSGEMVGIGTTNPTSKLHVFGDVNITGVVTGTAGAGLAAATVLSDAGINTDGTSTFVNILATGIATASDFNSSSDIKLKTNVQRISDPLDKIIRIEGVSFNWKKDNSPSIGVIANELEKVLPELVTNSDPKAVNYNGLIGVLIEAVKEQQSEIDSLKERISKLE